MRYLDNLVSVVTHVGLPWQFTGTIPANVSDKSKRTDWITNPGTKHSVFSAWEGAVENQRINDPQGATTEGNPPAKLYGLVADYDAAISPEEVEKGMKRIPIKPNWTCRSLSGNLHAVWVFEKPLLVPNREWAGHLLQHFIGSLKLEMFAAGFDKKAFLTPDRYYTNGLKWTEVHTVYVPSSLIHGWALEVSEKFNWKSDGVTIPLEEVQLKLNELHGEGFWPGDWVEGGQGPTFWVQASSSPKSAIIRATGMQTFSSHAHKSFFPWADLLGIAFVKQYTAKLMGRAVEGIYYDQKHFIRQVETGHWIFQPKDDVKDFLLVSRGLNGMRKKGEASEVDRAIEFIRSHNTVDAAQPRVFQAKGIQTINGQRLLNTFTGKCLPPVDAPQTWGERGNFPWISAFIDATFPGEQKEFTLSWLHRFYCGCLNDRLESNLALFIAGPPGVGKTFFGNGIVGRMVGGFEDAQDYLAQGGAFNAELFRVALWCVDDSLSAGDGAAHRRWGDMLKKVTANQNLKTHEKFKTPGVTNWQGAVVVTCNHDAESIQMIPGLDGSILDKLSLLRTCDKSGAVEFPTGPEIEALLSRELSSFCAYVRDYEIAAAWVGENRYGITPYHHPELVATAHQSSSHSTFREILDAWRASHFDRTNPKAFWSGTAFAFYHELVTFMNGSSANLGMKPTEVRKGLSGLVTQNYGGVRMTTEGDDRLFIIARPSPAESAPTPRTKSLGKSRYVK